jgi:hypothetical protein
VVIADLYILFRPWFDPAQGEVYSIQPKHINDRIFIEDLVISVISCKLVLLVEETGVLGEIHQPVTSH